MKALKYQKHYKLIPALTLFVSSSLLVGLFLLAACSTKTAPQDISEELKSIDMLIEQVESDRSFIRELTGEAVLQRFAQLNALLQEPAFKDNTNAQEDLQNALNFLVAVEDNIPRLEASCQYSLDQLHALKEEMINQTIPLEEAAYFFNDEAEIANTIHLELEYYINRWNAHQLLIETLQQAL